MARFLTGEWHDVVDAWQLTTWEDYRDVVRLGRKTRVGGKQSEILWSFFERMQAGLTERKVVTWPDLFRRVSADTLKRFSVFSGRFSNIPSGRTAPIGGMRD